jgi:hypothetical protein
MRHTVKAVFAHKSDARHVLDELLAAGYPYADTALSSELPAGQADRSVKRLAARLFGAGQHEHGAAYSGAFARGRHVVKITAGSESDVACAVAIIERFRPVGIEDHDDEQEHGSAGAGAEAVETMGADSRRVRPDDDMAAYRYGKEMRTSDKYRNRSWDEAEPGLSSGWKTRAPDTPAWDDSRPAIRRGWDAVTPEIDSDDYYRNHWTTRYAGSAGDDAYDDYKPAYIYGSEARRSEKYRSRDWRDVEQELKAGWQARHAGQLSSWENFKDAVNHGWNRVTLDDDRSAAYRHGADAARDINYRRLTSEWERRHAGSASATWDKVKAAVRHGWDRVRS